jgi:hypothetical protein
MEINCPIIASMAPASAMLDSTRARTGNVLKLGGHFR